jgi:hypothetical protein
MYSLSYVEVRSSRRAWVLRTEQLRMVSRSAELLLLIQAVRTPEVGLTCAVCGKAVWIYSKGVNVDVRGLGAAGVCGGCARSSCTW